VRDYFLLDSSFSLFCTTFSIYFTSFAFSNTQIPLKYKRCILVSVRVVVYMIL
jgi:hypothetical protein